jgi:hypothetical protein
VLQAQAICLAGKLIFVKLHSISSFPIKLEVQLEIHNIMSDRFFSIPVYLNIQTSLTKK